jgi:hypothetical protein
MVFGLATAVLAVPFIYDSLVLEVFLNFKLVIKFLLYCKDKKIR